MEENNKNNSNETVQENRTIDLSKQTQENPYTQGNTPMGQPQMNQIYQQNMYDRNSEFYRYQESKVQNMNTIAMISMIIGIIALVTVCCYGGVLGIVSLILGIIAASSIFCTKKKMALAGIIVSIVSILFTVIIIIVSIYGLYEIKNKYNYIGPKYNYEYDYDMYD